MENNKGQTTVGKRHWDYLVPVFAAVGLVLGGAFHLFVRESWGHWIWFVTLALGALPLTWRTLREIRRGKFGVDLIELKAVAGGGAVLAVSITDDGVHG